MPFKRTNQTGGCEHVLFGLQRSVQYAQIFLFHDLENSSLMHDAGEILIFFLKKGVGQTLGEMGTLDMAF